MSLALCALLYSPAFAQTTGDRVDLYFGDWPTSPSRITHGALEAREILTRGDAMSPAQKARFFVSSTHTLTPHWRRTLRRKRSDSTGSRRFTLFNAVRESRVQAANP